ncbi:hypothetical protein LCGC14_0401290 [marine sediment metagenome]|uniref:Calcineurin-like phosphoesterase domain-containing protein n=1 Tax=marine sediment metagenome TaxID=412755 RepID=A0A0F9VIU1_9ZZZZ
MLHFADLHLGVESHSRPDPATGLSTRVGDFLERLDEVVDYALNEKADLVVFAGDAFHKRDPNPTLLREFARRIKRLADEVPTLLLVGNHDAPGIASRANSIDIFGALDVPGVILGNRPEGQIVETSSGPVYLAWLPYPMRNRLLSNRDNQGKSIEELELALREAVTAIVKDLARQADEHDMPRVLAGHFTVDQAVFGSERAVMIGRDVAVNLDVLADPAWDYVALGHIHKHQVLSEQPPVVYSGSLERIDFGEQEEEKGFCWVELEHGKTSWSFVPVQAREFVTIRIDTTAAEIDDPTESFLEMLPELAFDEAVVRIIFTMRPDQSPALNDREIQASLPNVSSLSIIREIEEEARTRLGDLAVETLTPLQLLETYFQSKDMSPDRIEVLVERAEELLL